MKLYGSHHMAPFAKSVTLRNINDTIRDITGRASSTYDSIRIGSGRCSIEESPSRGISKSCALHTLERMHNAIKVMPRHWTYNVYVSDVYSSVSIIDVDSKRAVEWLEKHLLAYKVERYYFKEGGFYDTTIRAEYKGVELKFYGF